MNGDEPGCWFVVSRRFIAADGLNYFASRSDCSPTRPTIVEHTTNRVPLAPEGDGLKFAMDQLCLMKF